jgi:hypothetical protein
MIEKQMAFEKIDRVFWQGGLFNYQDLGVATKGGKTHKFRVISRKRRDMGTHVGYIRWANPSNCMSFYPLVPAVSPSDMTELAGFCTMQTQAHLETTDYGAGRPPGRKNGNRNHHASGSCSISGSAQERP